LPGSFVARAFPPYGASRGAIVDSLVQTQPNKHPVSLIWMIETSMLRDIAVLLVVNGALVLLATVVAVHNSLFTSPG
jgi:hypothetical protein